MLKIKLFLTLPLVFCIVLVGCFANFQQTSPAEIRQDIVAKTASKRDLAIAVLSEAEISRRYNLHLGNSLDALIPLETTRNSKFMDWMQTLFVREAGWNYVEAKYVAQLEKIFSKTELQELLNLTKQPLIKRLVKAEIEAYSASAEERRRLLSKLWSNYNRGMFNPPPEVLQ